MSEDTPSPVPADSASKVTRRAQFRNIFCATKMSCDKLKSLTRHLMAIFEEYHDDVRANSSFVFSVLLTCFPILLWRM
jgi:hypothetical protein